MDTWTRIEHAREALGDDLASLPADDWDRPSLCAGWTVRDVAAHLLVIPTTPRGKVFRSFVGAGFDLDRMNARFVARIAAAMSNADIVAATRSSARSRLVPPGLKVAGVLAEVVVHSCDIADAVGRPFARPVEDDVAVLDHVKDVQPVFGSKRRIAGLTLRATDAAWSTGSGLSVEGPARDLLLAVVGRRSALDRLSGDGLQTLRDRD